MDCYPVYAKWIREQAATQTPEGCVAQIAPMNSRKQSNPDGGIGWCDSFEIVPYYLEKRYDDNTLTEEFYGQIADWMRFQIRSRESRGWRTGSKVPKELRSYLLDNGWLWGEWLEPGQDVVPYMVNLMTHGDLELSSAYLSYGCALVAEMAESLGKIRGCGIFSRGQREGEGGLPVSVSEEREDRGAEAAVPLCPSHRAGDADGGGKAPDGGVSGREDCREWRKAEHRIF